jgi:cysteine-rich repeat protein
VKRIHRPSLYPLGALLFWSCEPLCIQESFQRSCVLGEITTCQAGQIVQTPCASGLCNEELGACDSCGDGITDPGEECDDTNLDNFDGCNSFCEATCGDGRLDLFLGEECDDGCLLGDPTRCDDEDNNDGCSSSCAFEFCGDGLINSEEECDPSFSTNFCHFDCTINVCGDGILGPLSGGSFEICDDGCLAGADGVCDSTDDNDGCDSNCTLSGCSNGVINIGEECDDGKACEDGQPCLNDNDCPGPNECLPRDGDGCDGSCTVSACGNGIVAGAELCDDFKTCQNGALCSSDANCILEGGGDCLRRDGDGCDNDCSPSCGNGVIDPVNQEQCDDGNAVEGDGCDSNCTPSACGNGVVSPGEECDAGFLGGDFNACRSDCTINLCGDTFIEAGEECDDGNFSGGDGCSPLCQLETCGNGFKDFFSDSCDDGNVLDGDGCDALCRLEPRPEIEPNEDGSPSPFGDPNLGNDFDAIAVQNAINNGVITENTLRFGSIDVSGDEDVFAIQNISGVEQRLFVRALITFSNLGFNGVFGVIIRRPDESVVEVMQDQFEIVRELTMTPGELLLVHVLDAGDSDVWGYELQLRFRELGLPF